MPSCETRCAKVGETNTPHAPSEPTRHRCCPARSNLRECCERLRGGPVRLRRELRAAGGTGRRVCGEYRRCTCSRSMGRVADPSGTRLWERDTLQVIFSGTKALVALLPVDAGGSRPARPVGASASLLAGVRRRGKEATRVIDLASHRARVPGSPLPYPRKTSWTTFAWRPYSPSSHRMTTPRGRRLPRTDLRLAMRRGDQTRRRT